MAASRTGSVSLRWATIIALALLLSVACRAGGEMAQPPKSSTGGSATSVALGVGGARADLSGPRSLRGVVLVVGDGDRRSWDELVRELNLVGYRVAALSWTARAGSDAVVAAAAALRREGVEKVVLVGSGASGADVVRAARTDIVGIALLSATARLDPVPTDGMPPASLLALAPLANREASATARRLYDAAAEPRTLVLFAGSLDVPEVLRGAQGSEVRTVLTDFLRAAFEPGSA